MKAKIKHFQDDKGTLVFVEHERKSGAFRQRYFAGIRSFPAI